MLKYILITFLFLGFAFYELSGGADFDPDTLRQSRIEASPLRNDPFEKETVEIAENSANTVALTEIVQRSAIEPLNVNSAAFQAEPATVQTPRMATPQVQPAREEPAENPQIANDAEVETELVLPSLIPQPGAEGTTTAALLQPQSDSQDIRRVTGNRVNVRGGPGTNYGVVGKLTRGAQVEIITDNGNGWVEFRAVDDDTSGWMADFLLSDG